MSEISRCNLRSGDCSLLLAPLVLPADLLLLGRGEVVLDVESLPDLLRSLAWEWIYDVLPLPTVLLLTLDHVGDGLAADVEQPLDVEVIGGQDQLEQGALVHLAEKMDDSFKSSGSGWPRGVSRKRP